MSLPAPCSQTSPLVLFTLAHINAALACPAEYDESGRYALLIEDAHTAASAAAMDLLRRGEALAGGLAVLKRYFLTAQVWLLLVMCCAFMWLASGGRKVWDMGGLAAAWRGSPRCLTHMPPLPAPCLPHTGRHAAPSHGRCGARVWQPSGQRAAAAAAEPAGVGGARHQRGGRPRRCQAGGLLRPPQHPQHAHRQPAGSGGGLWRRRRRRAQDSLLKGGCGGRAGGQTAGQAAAAAVAAPSRPSPALCPHPCRRSSSRPRPRP